MKRILGQGYIKKIDSTGTDNILIETLKDLHLPYRDKKFILQAAVDDFESIDAFDHYHFVFKIKFPIALMRLFRFHCYKSSSLTEIPELELDGYIPPSFNTCDDTKLTVQQDTEIHTKYKNFYTFLFNFFNKLFAQSVSSHQLEYILPMGMFTTFYWTVNLNELMTFLRANLRSEMPEMRELSQAMLEYFKEEFPLLSSVFLSRNFPRREQP